jgi:hypothetical protein
MNSITHSELEAESIEIIREVAATAVSPGYAVLDRQRFLGDVAVSAKAFYPGAFRSR